MSIVLHALKYKGPKRTRPDLPGLVDRIGRRCSQPIKRAHLNLARPSLHKIATTRDTTETQQPTKLCSQLASCQSRLAVSLLRQSFSLSAPMAEYHLSAQLHGHEDDVSLSLSPALFAPRPSPQLSALLPLQVCTRFDPTWPARTNPRRRVCGGRGPSRSASWTRSLEGRRGFA